MAGHYFQPCSHLSASLSSCQSMGYSLRDSTASSTHDSTTPSSSYSTSVTKKCFSRLIGVTAVHLLLRSLAGLILCMSVPNFSGCTGQQWRLIRYESFLPIKTFIGYSPSANRYGSYIPSRLLSSNERPASAKTCAQAACRNRPSTWLSIWGGSLP